MPIQHCKSPLDSSRCRLVLGGPGLTFVLLLVSFMLEALCLMFMLHQSTVKTFLSTHCSFSHITLDAAVVSQSHFFLFTWKLIWGGWGVRNGSTQAPPPLATGLLMLTLIEQFFVTKNKKLQHFVKIPDLHFSSHMRCVILIRVSFSLHLSSCGTDELIGMWPDNLPHLTSGLCLFLLSFTHHQTVP